MYEKKITELLKHLEDKNSHYSTLEAQMTEMQQQLNDNQKLLQVKLETIDKVTSVMFFLVLLILSIWLSKFFGY